MVHRMGGGELSGVAQLTPSSISIIAAVLQSSASQDALHSFPEIYSTRISTRRERITIARPGEKKKAPRSSNDHPTPVTSPTTAAIVPRDGAGMAPGESPVTCHFTASRSAAY